MSNVPNSSQIYGGTGQAAFWFQGPILYLTRLCPQYFLTPDALFFCACFLTWPVLLFLYGWMNNFPVTWHWDEVSKARQIMTGESNFNHPQLLITATRFALWLFNRIPSEDSVLIAGRWCSAVFACSAVVIFSLLAKRLCGNLAGLCALIWIGTGAFIFGLSHYFKEDTALLFGLSLFCFFLIRFEEFPSASRAFFLGLGAGLAASGKYIGLTVVPFGLLAAILIAKRAGAGGGRQVVIFVVTSVATFAVVNLPALTELSFFAGALKSEILHVMTEHMGFISPVTDTILVSHVAISCNVALASSLAFATFRRNELMRRFGITFLIIYPVALLALIQISVVKFERYTLPVIVLIQCLGACGFAHLVGCKSILLRVASIAALLLGLVWNLWQLTETMSALRYGSRMLAAEWIRSHLPSDGIIAQSPLVDLNGEGASFPKLPQTLRPLGAIDQMLADGVQYIVVRGDRNYDRFANGELFVAAGPNGDLAAKRAAEFRDILTSSHLLTDIPSKGTRGLFFSPRLTIYKFL